MSPEQSPQAASHATQDAAGRDAIDREIELGTSAADAAAKKKKETDPLERRNYPKYSRRYL